MLLSPHPSPLLYTERLGFHVKDWNNKIIALLILRAKTDTENLKIQFIFKKYLVYIPKQLGQIT